MSAPLVKITSQGRGSNAKERRKKDKSHLMYIGRMGTLTDETGQKIGIQEALKRFNHDIKTSSNRVVISLPKKNTEQALAIVQSRLAERYGSQGYVMAFHATSGKDNKEQPHLHVMFCGQKRNPWRRFTEAKDFRQQLGKDFEQAGIGFKKRPYAVRKTKVDQFSGSKNWKKPMRTVVGKALVGAGDLMGFLNGIAEAGYFVKLATELTITIMDERGKKCRLNKLYKDLGGKKSVEEFIEKNNQVQMKAEKMKMRKDTIKDVMKEIRPPEVKKEDKKTAGSGKIGRVFQPFAPEFAEQKPPEKVCNPSPFLGRGRGI